MLYCDNCARNHGYGFTITKSHGECELCGKRVGKMNIMDRKFVTKFTEPENRFKVNMCGFEMQQIDGFVPGTSPDKLHPGMRRMILSLDRMLFQGNGELILATIHGKQFRITF